MIFTALEPKDWGEVETALTDAFRRCAGRRARRRAGRSSCSPRRTCSASAARPGAILANALLCGMRTLAAEGVQANAVAVGAGRRSRGPAALDRAARGRPRRRPASWSAYTRSTWARSRYERAIVTGAARGIGARSRTGSAADHDVLRVDIDPSVDGLVADVTNPDDRARIVEAAGEVSVLVNNAGITRDARIVKMTEEDFLAVIRDQPRRGLRADAGVPLRRRRSVVSLASRAYLGNFGQFNYSISKGGLVGMTRALALELAPRVRVNAIAPA